MPEAVEDVGGRDPAPTEPGGAAEQPLGEDDKADAGIVVGRGRDEEGGVEGDAQEVTPGGVAAVGEARAVEGRGEAVAVGGSCTSEGGDEGAESETKNRGSAVEILGRDDGNLHG